MILKGSQRGGGGQLAAHLMNERDNDHVTVHELRGFVAGDLKGALAEAHAISKATRCHQFMFSLSLNPPKEADASMDVLLDAADRAEAALGLGGQPRAVIIHEKNGRRHAHVVWSRIDANELKAVNLPHFKNRLRDLSKELYLEHGWELPEGHRENGWKNPLNFTLAEWQQAKRLDLHPAELKQLFHSAWERSDGMAGFKAALEEYGFYLARGDRRGFVAVDLQGEVFSVSRMTGVGTKALSAKLGPPDSLPGVTGVREANGRHLNTRLRDLFADHRRAQSAELKAVADERRSIVRAQRLERRRLTEAQQQRWRRETAARQGRFRKGVQGLWDRLTGRAANIRKDNEREAYAGYRRDIEQRERLFAVQMRERDDVQQKLDRCREHQRRERMRVAGQISFLLKLEKARRLPSTNRYLSRDRQLDLSP